MTTSYESFALGDWLVEPAANQISTATESVYLRQQLMDVLVYLAKLNGQVATLESIHDDLWAGKVVSSGTIYNCIAELRQALAHSGDGIEYIETLPKKGYRLTPAIIAMPASESRRPDRTSIVILPLVNRSKDAEIEYLCEGISDEILHGLSKAGGLTVFSALSLKEKQLDARVVGLRFGAQMVLSGSLQRSGQSFRANFLLDDVATGETLWSGRYDHEMGDLFALQDTVAQQVIHAMPASLGTASADEPTLAAAGTQDRDALNYFLLGKHAESPWTMKSFDEAIDYYERAVAIDPGFARAHYRLYLANYMKRRSFGTGGSTLEKAKLAAKNAKEHGYKPAVPWIHIHRRLYRESRINTRDLALEAIEKIRVADSEWGSFGYEQLTWVLAGSGFFEATLEFAKHMLDSTEHNFVDSDADEELPYYYGAVGDFDAAIRAWSAEVQKDPTRPIFRVERSNLYSRMGQYENAQRDIDVMTRNRSRITGRSFLHYWQGDIDKVNECHEQLLAIPDLHPNNLFWSHCLIGDVDGGMPHFAACVASDSRAYIDLGNLRANCRCKVPPTLLEEAEQHPVFLDILKHEGIDANWQEELMQRLNDISDITGIVVKPDNF
jgi:TolB-like protein